MKAGNNARMRRGRYSLTERLKADNPVQFPMERSDPEMLGTDGNKVVPVGGGDGGEEKSDLDEEVVAKESTTR